ncbi:MAG: RNA pseudouridine synthase, partial [Muribaculaceae bacterium]|nr:RNA pseudouridine synthase [Muribaculaceae bacterium]
INLPLAPDILDRPRQQVDFEEGKDALTDYEFTACANGRSRVAFRPLTGRTHQLRVHAASARGLAMPIVGDRLYGTAAPGERLHLHAQTVEFTFPLDGHRYTFTSPTPF